MIGIVGKKVKMTSVFDEQGKNIPVTIIEASPNIVTQIKSADTDGYSAYQLGYGDRKEKNTSAGLKGHFKKSGADPVAKMVEFRDFDSESDDKVFETEKSVGDWIRVEEVFTEGDFVNVVGTSKGKGFQGVMRRHNFSGVGDATHGQHNRLRAPGSIGGASYPARVFKGMRMAGQMGGDRVKVQNLKIVKVYPEENLLLVSGAIPGATGSYVIVEK